MGFVVGVEGIIPVLSSCLSDLGFLVGVIIVCYSAVQIMFEIREWEQRAELASLTALRAKHEDNAHRIAVDATSKELQ